MENDELLVDWKHCTIILTCVVIGKPYLGSDVRLFTKFFWNHEQKTMSGFTDFSQLVEGPPGSVHGGCLATVMDELLGWTTFRHIHPHKAVTVNLNVNYRKFVPLGSIKKLHAYVEKQEGRKVFVKGHIEDGEGKIHAEATAIFLMMNLDNHNTKSLSQSANQ